MKENRIAVVCGADHNSQTGFLDAVERAYGLRDASTHERITAQKQISGVIAANMTRPEKVYAKHREAIAALTRSSDIQTMPNAIMDAFRDTPNFDMGWMSCFKDVSDRVDRGEWRTATTSNAHAWQLVPEGMKLKMEKVTGSYVTGTIKKYGSALGWTEEMIRYRDLGRMIDAVEELVEGYNVSMTNRHYALLTASSGGTISYQSTTGNTEAQNDIDTLDAGMYAILNALKSTRNLPITHPAKLIVPIAAGTVKRVSAMLNTLLQAVSGSPTLNRYNIEPIFTFNANMPTVATGDAFRAILLIPGYKIQSAVEQPPTLFGPDMDKWSLQHEITAWAFRGALVADTAQIRVLRFS